MVALFVVGIVFALALAVTLYAVVSAKDGYEDHQGFHAATRPTSPRLNGYGAAGTSNAPAAAAPVPPYAAAG